MDLKVQLQDLETSVQNISDGLEAIHIMVLGLEGMDRRIPAHYMRSGVTSPRQTRS